MKTLYMARRQVYPQETVVFGPFSNHEAALTCAQDSLYPEGAQVDTVDLSTVSTVYVPTSSYPEWVTREKVTYYGFQESFQDIPSHLEKELSIEVADIDSFASECFYTAPAAATEAMIIAGLVTGADQEYECMQVIRGITDNDLTALVLAQPFDRLIRARGFSDRRALLDLLEYATKIRGWLQSDIWPEPDLAEDLVETFWNRFVIDGSQPPEVKLERWESF